MESSSGGASNESNIKMLLSNSGAVHVPSLLPTNTTVLRVPKDISKRILSKCADGDIRAVLRLLTSEDAVPEESEEALIAFQSEHPPAPDEVELPIEALGLFPAGFFPASYVVLTKLRRFKHKKT